MAAPFSTTSGLFQLLSNYLHESMLALEIIGAVALTWSLGIPVVPALRCEHRIFGACWDGLLARLDALTWVHITNAAVLALLLMFTTAKLFSDYRRRRRINKILRIKRDRDILFVISSIPYGHNEDEGQGGFKDYFTWTTPQDGVEGVKRLLPLLLQIGVQPDQISVKFSEKVNDEELCRSNLFLIGGHQHNAITERFSRDNVPDGQTRPGAPSPMRLENNQILDSSGTAFKTELPKGVPVRDYGLVTRGINHYTDKPDGNLPCAVWSFEGVRHWGTLSGIDVLSAIALRKCSKKLVRRCPGLRQRIDKSGVVQFVTECNVDSEYDLNFEDRIVATFPPSKKSK
jgi:hypothetical protein